MDDSIRTRFAQELDRLFEERTGIALVLGALTYPIIVDAPPSGA